MSAQKHTPGLWTVNGIDRMHHGEIIQGPNDWVAVCCDFNQESRDAERTANACLIAAAPELLVALEQIMRMYDAGAFSSVDVAQAKAAIAKARGQS